MRFLHFFHLVWRTILHSKFYTTIKGLSLSIGLAVFLLAYLFVQHELTADRFIPDGNRIYRIINAMQIGNRPESRQVGGSRSLGPFLSQSTSGIESYTRFLFNDENTSIRTEETVGLEKNILWVDSTFFRVFALPMVAGDPGTALTLPNSVVLTKKTARKFFGDRDPVGKTLVFGSDQVYTVTGVIHDITEPTHLPSFSMLCSWNSREGDDSGWVLSWMVNALYVKLTPGVLPQHLAEQATNAIEERDGDRLRSFGTRFWLEFEPLKETYLSPVSWYRDRVPSKASVYGVLVIGLIILMTASLNFINLSTAQGTKLGRRVSLRKVLGASRQELIAESLLEAVLIAFAAMLFAVAVAAMTLPLFNNMMNVTLTLAPLWQPEGLFLLLVTPLAVGLFAGLYPSLILSTTPMMSALRGEMTRGQKGKRLRNVLVTTQFVVTTVLLITVFTVIRQIHYVFTTNLGFSSDQVVALTLGDASQRNQYRIIQAEMSRLPDVVGSTVGDYFPHSMSYRKLWHFPKTDASEFVPMNWSFIGDNYLDFFDIPLVQGRKFNEALGDKPNEVVIVNEEMVRKRGWKNPLDEAVDVVISRDPAVFRPMPVVGVVKDFHYDSLDQPIEPLILMPQDNMPNYVFLKLKAASIHKTLGEIKAKWTSLFPDQAMDLTFLDEDFRARYASYVNLRSLLTGSTVVAILISVLGLFALATFASDLRRRELGVRKVLGASMPNLVTLLLGEFALMVAVANLVAWPIVYFVSKRVLSEFVYQPSFGWWLYPIAGFGILIVAMLTVGGNAIRSASLNPVEVLRSE